MKEQDESMSQPLFIWDNNNNNNYRMRIYSLM